jgi:hypothetical protein
LPRACGAPPLYPTRRRHAATAQQLHTGSIDQVRLRRGNACEPVHLIVNESENVNRISPGIGETRDIWTSHQTQTRRTTRKPQFQRQRRRATRQPKCQRQSWRCTVRQPQRLQKPPAPHLILLEDYQNCRLAIASIQANAEALDEASFTADHQRDRALFAVYRGLTIEAIVKNGKEYEYGLYSLIESDDDQQVKRAA